MKKLMGEQVTNREINEILRDVDLNGDGLVNFEGERSFMCADEDTSLFSFAFAFFFLFSMLFTIFSEFVRMMSR